MTLLPDVECSEVEPQEIRLHSWHEGENAGSLLGTRRRALFLPHCRRRDYAALGRAFIARSQFPMIHYAAFEKASNEFQDVWISDAPCYLSD